MMRKALAVVVLGLMAVFSVPIAPAFAGELSVGPAPAGFQALSGLPDARRAELAVMTDEQLSAIEGTFFFVPVVFSQNAWVDIKQVNRSWNSSNFSQTNQASVSQSIH
jgi:hypothetical protein